MDVGNKFEEENSFQSTTMIRVLAVHRIMVVARGWVAEALEITGINGAEVAPHGSGAMEGFEEISAAYPVGSCSLNQAMALDLPSYARSRTALRS